MSPYSIFGVVATLPNGRHRRPKTRRLHLDQLEGRIAPALFNVQNPISSTALNNNGCVVAADLDQDGLDDAIFTNYGPSESSGAGNKITILYGKVGGGFNAPIQLTTGGTNVTFAAIADIDGDTWLDVVASNANSQNTGTVSVFKNTNGTLSLFGTPISVPGNNTAWVGLSDVTGDSILDLVTANFGRDDGAGGVEGANVTILEGNDDGAGHGDFTFDFLDTLAPEPQFVPQALAVEDFTGDGVKDIAAVSPGIPPDFGEPYPDGTLYLFKGTESGGFTFISTTGTGGTFPVNIQAGDLNGDTKLDVVIANVGNPLGSPEFIGDGVGVLLNNSSNGNFAFGNPTSLTSSTHGTFAVAITDFDMNGKKDIAAVNYGMYLAGSPPAFVSLYMGSGTGSFSPGSPASYDTLTGDGGGQYLAVGDFDDNGSPDLVIAHASNKVGVLLNTTVSGPTVTINQAQGQADPTNSTSITFTATFSEDVTGFTGSDIDFTGSSVSGLQASVTEITPSTYTVTVTGMAGTGTVRASIPAGSATSVNGSVPTLASTSTDNQVSFDLIIPTVTINQAQSQTDPATSGPILFTVIFNESVTGFTSADVDLTGSSLTGLTASVTQNTPSNYAVSVSGMSGNGTVQAAVKAGAATDAAGNASEASTSNDNTVTFGSSTAPTVTINQGANQPDPTNSTSILFDVVFSEGVTGFTGGDISFTGSSVGGLSASVTPIDSSHYTVTVTGMTGTGLVKASIPAGAATAIATAETNVASTTSDNEVTFDLVTPTVTINQAQGQADPTSTGPILFTVVFNENVTGFTSGDVDLSGSSLSGLTASVTQNSPSNYTVSVTGMSGNGTVLAKVAAGAATDAAGNASAASTSSDNSVTFDTSAPSVTINQAAGQADPTSVPSIQFDVIFGEPVTGFTASDVSLTGSTVGGTLSVNVTGSLDTYVVTVTGITSAGVVIANIPAGAATDAAGNASLAATSSDNSVEFGIPDAGTIGFSQAVFDTLEPEDTEFITLTITVTRSGGTDGGASINYSTEDGTAHSGGSESNGQDDYDPPTAGQFTWADGVGGDRTFEIKINRDDWNEGKELIHLKLSNLLGNSALGISEAAVAIAPSNGLGQGTYLDHDFDKYRIKLSGKTGSMEFFRTDPDGLGRGPIELIRLSGTLADPLKPKASLVISVTKAKTSVDAGTVGLGAITGSGLKSISARKANLNREGIILDGYLGSLTIGNIVNGADITTLAGANPLQKTRISALRILDGTTIDVGATLSSLKATSFGAGLVKAPRVGNMIIKGDMTADVDISGEGVSTSEKALNALRVKGAVTGSDIKVKGNIGAVIVGAFRDSNLFAGYIENGTTGTFNFPATVNTFRATGKADGFQNSRVFATIFKSVSIVNLDSTNSSFFGFYADVAVHALKVTGPSRFTFDPSLETWQGVDKFEVRIINP